MLLEVVGVVVGVCGRLQLLQQQRVWKVYLKYFYQGVWSLVMEGQCAK
jgi:hypothetical protein